MINFTKPSYLKACVRYFYQIFIFFTKWQPFKNYEKYFLFHQKSSFRSWDNQIFLFRPSLFFSLSAIAFRRWSKINLIVYDAIMCLNKNSITHFLWYLEKEKRYDTETLSIDGVSNKKHFYGKIMPKICSKS